MKSIRYVSPIMIITLFLMFHGCMTTSDQPQPVSILIEENYKPVLEVKNRNDPVEVIYFARTLAAAGRNLDAAKIYMDAAERFRSVDGKFENDCRKEAVRQYWLAGQKQKAWEILNQLNDEQDIYRRAAEEENLRMLRNLLMSDSNKNN